MTETDTGGTEMASYESRRQAAELYRDDRICRNDAIRGGLSEAECDEIDVAQAVARVAYQAARKAAEVKRDKAILLAASREAAEVERDKAILLAEATYSADLEAAVLAYNAVLNAAMEAARSTTT